MIVLVMITHLGTWMWRLVAAVALAGAGVPSAGQTTAITMKTSTSADPAAQKLRLMDVAMIQGPLADELGDAVVVADLTAEHAQNANKGWVEVSLDEVREALSERGVNWAKVTVRGKACTVRLGEAKAPVQSRETGRERAAHQGVDVSGPATVRTSIVKRLAAMYRVRTGDLRVAFNDEDAGTLDVMTGGRTVEVNPGATARSSRFPVEVLVYSGEQLALHRTVQVDVLVKREVVSVREDTARGMMLNEGMVAVGEKWVAPSARAMLRPEQASGAKLIAKAMAGQVLYMSDVQGPVACKRGDVVTVHCVSGSVVVKMKAKAMGSARDGEVVQLTVEGSKTPIRARMSGAGRAVLVGSEGDEGEDGQGDGR